jgi:hypothetical protein
MKDSSIFGDSGIKKNIGNDSHYIFNDYITVKTLLWSSYFGFKDFYSDYIIRLYNNKNTRIQELGMIRSSINIIGEIVLYVKKKKKEEGNVVHMFLTDDETKFLEKSFNVILKKEYLEESDYNELFRIFNKFMFESGITNLLLEKDNSKTDLY